MVEHDVLTPTKRGRKPKVKETPNNGAVWTESIKPTIVTETKAEPEAKPDEEVSDAPVDDVKPIEVVSPAPEAVPPVLPEREKVVMLYEKSPYNFLPPMTDAEFAAVKEDIRKHAYDKRFPIWHFEGKDLDGWHKDRACAEIFAEGYTDEKYKPVYREFKGTVREAKEFVARSAKGRNLNPEQLGMIAVHETPEYLAEIIEAVKKEAKENRKRKPKGSESSSPTNKNPNKRKSKKKVADIVGSSPNIMDTIEMWQAELSKEEFDQLAYDIEHKITTLKEFGTKKGAEKKAMSQTFSSGSITDPLTGDNSTKALGTGVDSKNIVIKADLEAEAEPRPNPEDEFKGKLVVLPTEISYTVKVEKFKNSLIDLQKKRSDVAKEIVAIGKLIKEHTDTDNDTDNDTTELVEDKKQLAKLMTESDGFKSDIKNAGLEFGLQLGFDTEYEKIVAEDFKGKITL